MNRKMRSRGHKERHDIEDDDDFWDTHSGILSKCRCIGDSGCMIEKIVRMGCVWPGVLCSLPVACMAVATT